MGQEVSLKGKISQVFVNVVYIQLNNSKVMIKGLGLVMSLNVLMMMKMLMMMMTLDLEIKKGLKVSSCMRAPCISRSLL